MREPTFSGRSALAGALAVSVLVVGLLLGGILGFGQAREPGASARAIELSSGVPVGVERTPAGALAAADNYLALASQSVEQDPSAFAALLAQAYAPEIRARTLAQARQLRSGDIQNMSNYAQGGRGIAIIAARRLDTYSPEQATVTSWLAGFVWGPRLSPRQTWNLVDTTLRWQAGRWLVVASNVDATPAPVPSIVYVSGANNRAAAFQRLAGMTGPFYGTGG
jgi:hypothetical protein